VTEVAEHPFVLADVGTRVRAPVGARIEAGAAEEVVLDELQVRVEAQHLVVDVAALRVRADDDARDAQSVAVPVDARRADVVVEPTPVVPGEEDRGRRPVGAAHDGVHDTRHIRLPA
jgi:hypothetical protein